MLGQDNMKPMANTLFGMIAEFLTQVKRYGSSPSLGRLVFPGSMSTPTDLLLSSPLAIDSY